MVREVASKTNDLAGDGTTTATVLAASIFREGAKLVAAGMSLAHTLPKSACDSAVAVPDCICANSSQIATIRL